MILGEVSGGLVCRDFDDASLYWRWKCDHPDLAARLPTVKTARGCHVYFRARPPHLVFRDLRPTEQGEYRGDSAHYCLLPPSRHPDGPDYKWLGALPHAVPLIEDVVAAGLLPEANVTQKAQGSHKKLQVVVGGRKSKNGSMRVSKAMKDTIEEAMARSVPTGPGQRRAKLLEIARQLKFAPEFDGIGAMDIEFLKPYLRRWWKQAKPYTSGKHPDFHQSWQQFVFAWEEAKVPYREAMQAIFDKARSTPPPKLAVEKYGKGSARALLASFCRELQRFNGDAPFFLSGRAAEPYFPVSAVQLWRFLGTLTEDGFITPIKTHPKGTRLATEYRYLAPLEDS